jgi:hypothetical protein
MARPTEAKTVKRGIFIYDEGNPSEPWKAWDGEVTIASGVITVDPVTPYSVVVDEASATIIYIGEATPGTATSSATWRVKRVDSATITAEILYADGDDTFDNVWDNRAALSYS